MSQTTHPQLTRGAYSTVNPATGEVVLDRAAFTDAEAEEALAKADAAFGLWRSTTLADRIALFEHAAAVFAENLERYAQLNAEEAGKPLGQGMMEASTVVEMFRYYAERAPELLADRPVELPLASQAYTRKEPIGVVLAIEPWNAPIYQAMRATVPNLMLGNTVIMKPAALTANSTLLIDELMAEAGFPPGVYQTILPTREQVSRYIADPRVRAVTFTGSNEIGTKIGQQAAEHVKPAVLELGGSDPFVVLDSADVASAAGMSSMMRLMFGGQVCYSPKRVIVTDRVADEFIEQYTAFFREQVVGDPLDPATTLGPMASARAASDLQALYDDAVGKGATVLVAGGRAEEGSAYFHPAVLTGVVPGMRLYYEEAFGPLGVIYRAADAADAVRLANDTPYGLGATVYGEDLDEARLVAEGIDSGGVGINTLFGAPVEAPFGGTKASGIGRELGETGMDAFANHKTYAIG
ncbi:aldehyde dehydrogenase family protein [Microbacterium thalassium]|uniref:Succinate-semialdehyde dehydrogenase/glutarate-semialdehyde dehydrogenase n=1 Tax=Microbacterium thalassium TaxID=362649 RepID=A0A7X0KTW2_9MICO|nr:aldehyde dehydrogenase family protein [Microbacterium thalassium]MBB6390499.1 succinate-semialdehyde dehydrogenase/glutarate-semialdehyde dehydrogenase [Microbacterium thalassium]GLK25610.1 succinate-semialdehyde dehydrogenase [Microbacterium thalassium]